MGSTNHFSNFNFLEGVNPTLCRAIKQAERMARINIIDSGRQTRTALEAFIDSVLKDTGLEDEVNSYESNDNYAATLNVKIKALKDRNWLNSVGYSNAVLPDIGRIDYLAESNDIKNTNYITYIRIFGNSCTHHGDVPYNPKVTFENLILCLKGCYALFSKYYASRIHNKVGRFQLNKMPIDNFYITESIDPSDKSRSKCDREYIGYMVDARHRISYYAILRQYKKEDVNDNFMLRNYDVFLQASRSTILGVPEGMTSFRTIVDLDNRNSPFYITAHLFTCEPKPLNQQLLQGTSLKQRLQICLAIANCFYNLHNAEEPIYHRLLNYDSIVICDYNGTLVPYVVKFDYGKIDTADQFVTVFQQVKDAEKSIKKERSLIKYLAPEWNNISSTENVNWEKIDIYSLGVLFTDIILGHFNKDLDSNFDELEDLELSEELLDVLDMMASEIISERPDLEYVQSVLQEEIQ